MNIKFTVSAEKNNNKIISSSEDKFAGVVKGSLIKIENDSILHTVQSKESFFYIKDFLVQNSKIIVIEDDTKINLQSGDSLKITYKEYESKFIIDVLNGGVGYNVGDIITVKDGVVNIDISSGLSNPTTLEVIEVNMDGAIQKLGIKESGRYITPPSNPIKTYSKNGNNCEIELKYLELSNRAFIEKEIDNIYFSNGQTFIVLNSSLPLNLKNGKLSVEKAIVTLSENYNGETRKNLSYEIFRDFTPNLRIPLLVRGSLSHETVYNKGCLILDAEIQKIKDKLGIS
jgi:hypothetical protein